MDPSLSALVAEQGPGALIATDAAGQVVYWNAAAESIFGYAPAEACGQALAALIVPPAERAEEARLRAEALDGNAERYEVLRVRKDGVPLYVNCGMRPLRDASGRVLLLTHMADATRHRARRDADLVQARFQGVLESAPDAIVIVNGTGRIVLFNAQARALFGHAETAMIGEPIERLLPQRLRHAHVDHRAGYIGAPRMRAMGEGRELNGVRASGEEFPVEISLSPIETEAGRLVMSAIRDISERKRFERTLQEKNVELERASRAKDHFLATMSHELRTPLNAIIGFTGLMLMKLPGPLTADQEKQLGLVQSSGKHLLSLINDLLDLAKIESGNVELHLEPVDCRPIVEEVVQTLRPQALLKGLQIGIDWPDVPVIARADRRALQQILLNLAANAVKFTPRGRVALQARIADDGAPAHAVALSVEDTGLGISAEDQQRLFQAFTQVGDALARRKAEGTGLGLHLSLKLAELMHGRIDVHSVPGEGSRFTLRLAGEG
jgi:PAS domain S-box-containing protein